MILKAKQMGEYATNCYILTKNDHSIVIDPGVGATNWVLDNSKKIVAILNTHGHFDHIWSNKELKKITKAPIYIHKDDAFMLKDDIFALNTPTAKADFTIDNERELTVEEFKFRFIHMPGHTPGCCIIEIEDMIFSEILFLGEVLVGLIFHIQTQMI